MKINIPQKFPKWFSSQVTQYTSDIVRTRNLRISELDLTGEIDAKNTLSFLKDYSTLVTAIFRDPNYLLSFAIKNKMYHIDRLKDPTITEYDPDISDDLNPASTGVLVYPRGHACRSYGTNISGSGQIATSDITTFSTVTNRTRRYTYTAGQKVLAVFFYFTYTQSTGTNISRMVITDANGDHVVATEDEHASGRGWGFWVVDGDGGCNLNGTAGFTAKVEIATDSSTHYIDYSDGDRFDFMIEKDTTQLLTTSNNNIYARYDNGTTDIYRGWYPGPANYTATVRFGYDYNQSIFSIKYPTIMKMFNDKILMIGNANSLHTVETTGGVQTVPGDNDWNNKLDVTMGTFTLNRLVFPSNYIIKWIDCSNDTVYIGATQYTAPFDEVGKSVVLLWQPGSDRQEMYDVADGENIGKVLNNFLYILTSKGNVQILYNGKFETITKIFETTENYNIQLPHPNGIVSYGHKIMILLPGNKYVPAGIYVFDTDTKQIYHKHSIYHSTTNKYDYGGNQPQVVTGALAYMNDNGENVFYAGIDNVMKHDGSFTGGLFDSLNSKSNKVSSYGYLETARMKTKEIDQYIAGLVTKYRNEGSIIVSEKKQETIGSCLEGIYEGTWTTGSDPTTFTVTTVPTFMKKGDRITVLDGTLRGFSTTIKGISGTTITIDPPSRYSAWTSESVSGDFTYSLEVFGYNGALTDSTTMTVSASVAAKLAVGEELEFIAGLGAGIINYITEIDGTTITLQNAMPYVAGNYTIFINDKYGYLDTITNTTSTENWKRIDATNEPLASDFAQYKLILNGDIKIRDIQTNVKPNLSILDNKR
ncbi:MAG: hypothetical protein ACTSPI_11015 [Candidatus Heimdallarchaeaceae archaeon]